MALTIDEMRAKMTSVFTGEAAPVVKLEESTSASVSGSAAVEALRNQLLGKLVTDPIPKVTESVQHSTGEKSHRELLEEVINNQVRAIKEEDAERDQLRERVGIPRLDIIAGMF